MSIQIESQLREIETVHLGNTIVSIAACDDYFAVGCLDDAVKVWYNIFYEGAHIHYSKIFNVSLALMAFVYEEMHPFSCIFLELEDENMGSRYKYSRPQIEHQSVFDTPIISAFKIIFAGDILISCGDLGKLGFYDIFSREVIKRIDIRESFLTAMGVNTNEKTLIIGNVNGDAFLVNVEEKIKMATLKPHNKTIRSKEFCVDEAKMFTCSDDFTVGMSDIENEVVQQRFSGHIEKVTCLKKHKQNPNVLYSSSSDKTIRTWDSRNKYSVSTFTAQEPIWAILIVGNQIFVGGEIGELHLLSIG